MNEEFTKDKPKPTMAQLLKHPLQFIDKDKGANLDSGFEYYAVGLVTGFAPEGAVRDKEVLVRYLDPWGFVHEAWRSFDEITITPVNRIDGDYLAGRLTEIDNLNQRKLK